MALTGVVPDEVIAAWGDLPYLRQVLPGEWHAACPQCGTAGHDRNSGDPDRFFIIAEGDPERTRGKCRRCGYQAFAMNVVRRGQGVKLSEEERRRIALEREFELKRQAAARAEKHKTWLESRVWEKFHANMAEAQRQWWEKAGIPGEWQDRWQLGWTPELWSYGQAYTIPFFDLSGQPCTLQYRLAIETDRGKYRFEPDLGPAAFVARPELGLAGQVVYVVEGAKKAMVTHILGTRGKLQVVGFPSANSDGGILPELKKAGRVYFLLDPDTWRRPDGAGTDWRPWPIRYAREVGKQAYALRLASKIDDMLLYHGIGVRDLESMLRFARSYG